MEYGEKGGVKGVTSMRVVCMCLSGAGTDGDVGRMPREVNDRDSIENDLSREK